MRPNNSAPSLTTFHRSPLGAFLLYGLLAGLIVVSSAAQTRLDTSQIAPLKGDVQGAFASTKLRDSNSAADHGNGTSNAIGAAIIDCGVSISCSIIVPPSYGLGESVPGYQLNYGTPSPVATTPGNIAIFDGRYSDARMLVNNLGYTVGFINAPSGWVYNYYAKAPQNASLSSFFIRQWSLDGGNNQKSTALAYADKTTWAGILVSGISHSPGQHVNFAIGGQNTSLGTATPLSNTVNCYGGFTSEADLGCHAIDNVVVQGNVEYTGTLTGSPYAGASAVSVAPTQGRFTQGAGRFLVKTNAGLVSAGTISQVSTPFGAPAAVTGSGTSWPVSAIVAQLGTNVGVPGAAVVTPVSFTAGSMALLQSSSLVCVSDSESFEMIYPTAITATTFTANFAKIHPSSAVISSGGLCGYLLDFAADDVADSTFTTKTQTISGTLHFAWPVIASTSATTANVWVVGDGGWQQMVTRWNSTSANGYVLYPYAEVTSTQQAGTLSDNLTLGPNNVSWATGDTVAEFLYPAGHFLFGNSVVESFYPNTGITNGFSLKYNMPLQGNEAMLSVLNNSPTSFYASKGGRYGSPSALHLYGPTTQTFTADLPADNSTVGFGCASPCTVQETLIAAENSAYYDFLFYDTGNKHWNISGGANAVHYGLGATQFALPFSNVAFLNDANSKGYVALQELRSASSSNSDISGEVVFSISSSATQALQGTYVSHPECLARPQFDPGATNRYWITYGSTSFTVSFATPVTGSVTYSCAARN